MRLTAREVRVNLCRFERSWHFRVWGLGFRITLRVLGDFAPWQLGGMQISALALGGMQGFKVFG